MLIAPLATYGVLGWRAWQMFLGDQSPFVLTMVAVTLIALFSVALTNSWGLLVELTYEKKKVEQVKAKDRSGNPVREEIENDHD
ncbi:MAG: hypothetical protein M1281_01480 [Chloroflexi bacterium]|nr:hypothetical protein [Chloroflexota bacterium]